MDFAETLMSEFEDAHSEYMVAPVGPSQAAARLSRARNDILQALRVPKGGELTVRDRFAMAALTGILANSEKTLVDGFTYQGNCARNAFWAFDQADAAMAERSRREAQGE